MHRFINVRLFSDVSKQTGLLNNGEKLNAIQNLTHRLDDINNKVSAINKSMTLNNHMLFFNFILWNSVYFPVLIFCSK